MDFLNTRLGTRILGRKVPLATGAGQLAEIAQEEIPPPPPCDRCRVFDTWMDSLCPARDHLFPSFGGRLCTRGAETYIVDLIGFDNTSMLKGMLAVGSSTGYDAAPLFLDPTAPAKDICESMRAELQRGSEHMRQGQMHLWPWGVANMWDQPSSPDGVPHRPYLVWVGGDAGQEQNCRGTATLLQRLVSTAGTIPYLLIVIRGAYSSMSTNDP